MKLINENKCMTEPDSFAAITLISYIIHVFVPIHYYYMYAPEFTSNVLAFCRSCRGVYATNPHTHNSTVIVSI